MVIGAQGMGGALAAAALAHALPAPAAAQGQDRPPVTMRTLPPQEVPPPPPPPSPALLPPLAVPERFIEARDHLVALRDGRLSVADLTEAQLQDVLALDRALRGAGPDAGSYLQQCIDAEVRRVGGNPSRLERAVIDLKCRA